MQLVTKYYSYLTELTLYRYFHLLDCASSMLSHGEPILSINCVCILKFKKYILIFIMLKIYAIDIIHDNKCAGGVVILTQCSNNAMYFISLSTILEFMRYLKYKDWLSKMCIYLYPAIIGSQLYCVDLDMHGVPNKYFLIFSRNSAL